MVPKIRFLLAALISAVIGGTGITLVATRPGTDDFDIGTGTPAIASSTEFIKHELTNKFKNHGCSQKFFPGAEIKHDDGQTVDQISQSDFFIHPPSGNGNSSKIMGCSSMQLVYKQEESIDEYPPFTFQAEVAVRNDKVSLIAGAGGDLQKNKGQDPSRIIYVQNLKYRVIFLENESNVLKIRGGYSWQDGKRMSSSFNMNISGPDGPGIKYNDKGSWQDRKNRTYVGVWKVKGSGKEIFQDIYVSSDEQGEDVEFFGRSNLDFEAVSEEIRGYKSVDQKYVGNIWITYSTITGSASGAGADISSLLKQWYAPFKEQKGEWIEINEYCKRKSNENSEGYGVVCKKT